MAGGALAASALSGAARAAPAGKGAARLASNENAFGPSPNVRAAITARIDGLERYVEQAEVDALAARIAAFEGVAPGQVVIGELLEALGLFLAGQRTGGGKVGGGNVVYSDPGYTALVDAAAPLGTTGRPVPLDARLENDLPALLAAIDERTLAVSLVNPHNPSGTVSDRARLDAFIIEASRRTLVVVDEAYLEYDDYAGRSAIRLLKQGASVLVFRTLAKIYGLAGLSIGYAVAPAGLAEAMRKAGIGHPHSLNRLALAAAEAAIGDQAHVARVRAATLSERARVTAVLDELRLRHTDSRANFVFFQTPRHAALREAFARADIRIGRPFAPLQDWVRITIGRPEENDRVIESLRAFHA